MRQLLSVRCSSSTAPAGPHQQKVRSLRDIRSVTSSVQHAHRQSDIQMSEWPSRRQLLLAGTATATLAAQLVAPRFLQQRADADEAPFATAEQPTSNTLDLQLYENTKHQYRLQVPGAWERKEKAGADVLFEDPERRSTSVGVTVSPVRVASIDQFGDLQAVGQRLLQAEQKKESTMGVELLTSSKRQGANGAALYDYEYELDSTRGKKRIFNTVTITGSKLYILNANFKCDKEEGCGADGAADTLGLLRQVAASFDAGSS